MKVMNKSGVFDFIEIFQDMAKILSGPNIQLMSKVALTKLLHSRALAMSLLETIFKLYPSSLHEKLML